MILSKEDFENIDKFFKNDDTMDIYTAIGSKVIFAFPDNGMTYERKIATKYLKLNHEHTIERIDVGGWHTTIYLKEFPDIPFNSVHFRNKGGK